MTKHDWRAAAERDLGVQLHQWQQLGGGDFAQSWRAQVVSASAAAHVIAGSSVFVKTHGSPPPRHFSTEARGLEWLQEVDAVRVPRVLGFSDNPPYLALEWVEEGDRSASSENSIGASLARLHQAPCAYFGREDERTTGSLGLPNSPCLQWSEFYATQRLLPLARIASDHQALSASTINRIEHVAERLPVFVADDVSPSRLHGDLWAGNRLVDTHGDNWLIDPACHGGHREFDLAMMRLFGGFGDACFEVYHQHFPLDEGWQERIALHQLAPLIVHAIKFGQAYVAPTEEALAKYV